MYAPWYCLATSNCVRKPAHSVLQLYYRILGSCPSFPSKRIIFISPTKKLIRIKKIAEAVWSPSKVGLSLKLERRSRKPSWKSFGVGNVKPSKQCLSCPNAMPVNRYKKVAIEHAWRCINSVCSKFKVYVSILKGSYFESINLDIRHALLIPSRCAIRIPKHCIPVDFHLSRTAVIKESVH